MLKMAKINAIRPTTPRADTMPLPWSSRHQCAWRIALARPVPVQARLDAGSTGLSPACGDRGAACYRAVG